MAWGSEAWMVLVNIYIFLTLKPLSRSFLWYIRTTNGESRQFNLIVDKSRSVNFSVPAYSGSHPLLYYSWLWFPFNFSLTFHYDCMTCHHPSSAFLKLYNIQSSWLVLCITICNVRHWLSRALRASQNGHGRTVGFSHAVKTWLNW